MLLALVPAPAAGAQADAAGESAVYQLPSQAEAKAAVTQAGGSPTSLEPLKDFMREQEVNYLNRTLAYTAGDKEKAAELLGISLATLYRKLAEVPAG